jgi:hypothetical protein
MDEKQEKGDSGKHEIDEIKNFDFLFFAFLF